ncbi:MAG: hypothetical protein QOF98_3305, partial [Streptomyces sp.]|nr:hypothetical protein [Streptomyces sp.]
YAGLQFMSHTLSDYQDLSERVSVFQRHILPSIAVPPVLTILEMGPDRGERLVLAEEAAAAVAVVRAAVADEAAGAAAGGSAGGSPGGSAGEAAGAAVAQG